MDADQSPSCQPKPVLKVATNQVAGHQFEAGRLGSLVDDSGCFYKPLQSGLRGDKEIAFYEEIWKDKNVPAWVQSFFPRFCGEIDIDAPDGSGTNRHLIMEDLTHSFHHPSIVDLKIGARTWYPEAGEKYISKCRKKDVETTSGALGFRLSGMQVYELATGTAWKADRKWCKYLTTELVPLALKRFVSSNPSDETSPDVTSATAVYAGPQGAIAQLQQLKAWFESQTFYHFYSASVLIIYEGELPTPAAGPHSSRSVSVRLVDFAHVLHERDAVDENFLGGLNSLIRALSSIVEDVAGAEISQKPHFTLHL